MSVFHLRQGLVLALLQSEAPANIRAALDLLGAIHWRPSSLPKEAEVPSQPPFGTRDYDGDLAALTHLLGILCDVFDCSWEAEQLPLDSMVPRIGGGTDKAEAAVQAAVGAPPPSTGPRKGFGQPQPAFWPGRTSTGHQPGPNASFRWNPRTAAGCTSAWGSVSAPWWRLGYWTKSAPCANAPISTSTCHRFEASAIAKPGPTWMETATWL